MVAFKDMSNDHVFLCRSAVSTKETIEVNGETYPVYKMEISNTYTPIESPAATPRMFRLPHRSFFGAPYLRIPDCFSINGVSATLYVPTGCKAAYAAAVGWSKFTIIETEF